MISLGMAPIPGLDEMEKAAVKKRLGLNFIHSGESCLVFDNAMDEGEKEALLKKADSDNIPVLLAAESLEALEEAVLWVNLWRNRMCEPDEMWDVYDAQGQLTGLVHRRAEPLKPHEYHLCVHVWTRNKKGEFLLTQRSRNKSMPGLWESTGGSVTAGEDSFSAALREVYEETGLVLEADAGEFLFRYSGLSFHCDVWLFRQEFDIDAVKLLEGETCAAMAADVDTIARLLERDEFVPYEYINDFLEKYK